MLPLLFARLQLLSEAREYYIYIRQPKPKQSCKRLEKDAGVEGLEGGTDPADPPDPNLLGELNTAEGGVVRARPVLGGSLSRYIFQLLGEDERLSQTRPRGASESGLLEAKPLLELQECFVRG